MTTKYKVYEKEEQRMLFENLTSTKQEIPINKSNQNVNSKDTKDTKDVKDIKDIKDNAYLIYDRIKEYLSKNKSKLYILTPCYNGMCYVNYTTCLMNTIELFKNVNFPIQIEFCKGDSLIPRARNNLIARAMNDPDMTHIIFIDNDITWNPIDIFKLILSDKHVIGGIYPLKHYNWNKLVSDPNNPYNSNVIQTIIQRKNNSQLKDLISDEDMIKFNMLSYNVNHLGHYLSIEKNLAKVRHAATGFLLIQREVFEQMFLAFPSTKYVDDVHFLKEEENKHAYALFDCSVEEGHYFSEDWLFCNRWLKMGGEVFIDVSINLTHSGVEDYSGSFISSIV